MEASKIEFVQVVVVFFFLYLSSLFFFFIAHWNKKRLVRETSGDEGGEVKPWLGATDGPADY